MNACGFDQKPLTLIHSYLRERSQKVKVISPFNNEVDILCVVPQVSILCSLLFNIDISDLFFVEMSYGIANDEDDTTPCKFVPYYDKLKENLELTMYKIFNWFEYNNFKSNATKCHFFLSLYQSANININCTAIKSSNSKNFYKSK